MDQDCEDAGLALSAGGRFDSNIRKSGMFLTSAKAAAQFASAHDFPKFGKVGAVMVTRTFENGH
jgi:hypothetical protein